MATHVLQTSFAAGEISPALYARTDLEKYHSGAALLRNFFVDYKGGAPTRAGTQFIDTTLAGARLIPFVFNTLAAYVCVFTDHSVTFIGNGASISGSTIASPYAVADLPLVKYAQSADVLTLTHPSYPPYNLTRTSSTTFTLLPDVIGSTIGAPGGITLTSQNNTGNLYTYGYVITAVDANGQESLPSFAPIFANTDILNQNTGVINSIQWDPIAGASFYRIYKVGPTSSGFGNAASVLSTVYGYIGQSTSTSFVDNNIAADFGQTPPQAGDPFAPGQIAEVDVSSGGSGYTDRIYTLIFTGDGTGAQGYALALAGAVIGVVITNPGRGYTTCAVTDSGPNTATYIVTLGQETGTYPAAVGYFQQRRVFGGTTNFPESLVFSQPGSYDNFNTSPISQASDSITVSVASREVNAIKAIVAMPTGLIVLTTGGAFLVSGGGQNEAITPTSVVAFPQASSGCNDLPPLVVNYDVLYAQNRGAVVRDLAFNFYVQSYTGTDRSVLAAHLFTGFELLEWCYAEEPFRQVQVVRNDGTLLNFTYVPEQEIFAWSHHDTQGFFRSIASIPEGQENAVYVVVQRFIGGDWVYFVERFASRLFDQAEDSWCLDSALSLPSNFPNATLQLNGLTATASASVFVSGDVGSTIWADGGWANVATYVSGTEVTLDPPIRPFPTVPNSTVIPPLAPGSWQLLPNVTTVSGLGHLEGQTVSATANGVPVSGLVVTGGSISLPMAASKVVVGLPFQCQLQTLKIDMGDPTVQGRRKQISAVTARVFESLGLTTGPTFDNLTPVPELIPTYPPTLRSTDARTSIAAQWTKEGQICFQQDAPLPATILGVIHEVIVGDTGR